MKNVTLVLGASTNPNKYSNIAIKRLIDKGISVAGIGARKGKIFNVIVDDEKKEFKNIDTVTLYLNPKNQEEYYNYVVGLAPKRVIFNPGSENDAFVSLLEENNIKSEVACTLVMLSTNQY